MPTVDQLVDLAINLGDIVVRDSGKTAMTVYKVLRGRGYDATINRYGDAFIITRGTNQSAPEADQPYVYHVEKTRRLGTFQADVRSVFVQDAEGVPLDRFDIFRPDTDRVWYAWTSDTFSQERKERRHEITEEINAV